MKNFHIKMMETDAEIEGKARVHALAFQETYRELLSSSYLREISFDRCLEWARSYPEGTLIAKIDEQVVGFACYGQARETDIKDTGEIFALYVLTKFQSQKIGYALLKQCLQNLEPYSSQILYVLKGNEKAITFYKKFGFVFDGYEKTVSMGQDVIEQRMMFRGKYD